MSFEYNAKNTTSPAHGNSVEIIQHGVSVKGEKLINKTDCLFLSNCLGKYKITLAGQGVELTCATKAFAVSPPKLS